MPDAFGGVLDRADAPARRLVTITPSDSTDLADVPKALWVRTAGAVSIVAVDDLSNTGTDLGTLPVGTVIPVRARRVRSTGTTAGLVGFL